AKRYRFSALRDDAGEERDDEGLEHRPDLGDFLSLHLGNAAHAIGRRAISTRVRALGDRKVLRYLPGNWHRRNYLPDPRSPGVPEERSTARERDLARVQFSVQ